MADQNTNEINQLWDKCRGTEGDLKELKAVVVGIGPSNGLVKKVNEHERYTKNQELKCREWVTKEIGDMAMKYDTLLERHTKMHEDGKKAALEQRHWQKTMLWTILGVVVVPIVILMLDKIT